MKIIDDKKNLYRLTSVFDSWIMVRVPFYLPGEETHV